MQLVYFLHSAVQDTIKIGSSTTTGLRMRLSDIQVGNSDELSLLGTIEANPINLEMVLHQRFNEYRVRGEWFEYSFAIQEYIQSLKTTGQFKGNPPSRAGYRLLAVMSPDVWMSRTDIARLIGYDELKQHYIDVLEQQLLSQGHIQHRQVGRRNEYRIKPNDLVPALELPKFVDLRLLKVLRTDSWLVKADIARAISKDKRNNLHAQEVAALESLVQQARVEVQIFSFGFSNRQGRKYRLTAETVID